MSDEQKYDLGFAFGIAGATQGNEIREEEQRWIEEREKLNALHAKARETGDEHGITGHELSQLLNGQEEKREAERELNASMDRINKEAADAVAAKEKENGQQRPEDGLRFPAPILKST